jgi:DNA-binding beta-propeller fold protein YncE
MPISSSAGRKLAAFAALALLAGCAQGGTPMAAGAFNQAPGAQAQSVNQSAWQSEHIIGSAAMRSRQQLVASERPIRTPNFFRHDATGKPLIFVSDQSGFVDIYLQSRKNKMVGQITGLSFSEGIATDIQRQLYVSNSTYYVQNVLVYAPPYTGSPKLILDDTGYYPQGVAVSKNGLVAVVNITCTASSCSLNSGSIAFYPANSTKPCLTLAAPNLELPESGAFDDNGNLYVANLSQYPIAEVKGGCNAKKITTLTTANTLKAVYSIQIDKADQIVVLDSGANTVYAYSHPRKGALGTPVSTTPLTTSGSFPYAFAFLASGADFYATQLPGSNALANEYAFPAGGTPENSITVGNAPQGIAVTPPLIP